MLQQLTIKNYALIEALEMKPSPRLNVITGETGAGKSIMLGAIGLLMGNRADTKVLWNENEKCISEAIFDISQYNLKALFEAENLDFENQTILRREISPAGKSRAFINDTPVTLDVLKKISSQLMDIHSQHETLQLGNHAYQLTLVDTFAGNSKQQQTYTEAWSAYNEAKRKLATLLKQSTILRQEADYITFQLDELLKANLEEGEQEKLESEVKIQDHAEDIKRRLNLILDVILRSEIGGRSSLIEARNNIAAIAALSEKYEAIRKRMDSVIVELDDLMNEVESEAENIDFDPQRAEFIKERLSTFYKLQKKHNVNSLVELISIQDKLQEQANQTENLEGALKEAEAIYKQREKALKEAAKNLSTSRNKVLDPLAREIIVLLKEVGIPSATVKIESQTIDFSESGADQIEILFSANKGIATKPMNQVASGGEFSRLMFCIKFIMAQKTAMPTLILDEIDTGVSGEIAIKLGNLMKTMAKSHQLISISHLPQIAAKSDAHYFVYKEMSGKKTTSKIKLLETKERVEEIAKMIGGDNPSKGALAGAKELLQA